MRLVGKLLDTSGALLPVIAGCTILNAVQRYNGLFFP